MNNMEKVIKTYEVLLLQTIEKKNYLKNLYSKKLNLYYTSNNENILKEIEDLEKEINDLNESISSLNNFINECTYELVNGLNKDNKRLYNVINNSNYLYFSLLNHFNLPSSNKSLNMYKLIKYIKINGYTLELKVFMLLDELGFNMELEGTSFIGYLIIDNISSESINSYNINKNYTNKNDIINAMNISVNSVNLNKVDKDLFNSIFPYGMSTDYKDVIKDVSYYLKKEMNKKTLKN